jgi:hypothetical protein
MCTSRFQRGQSSRWTNACQTSALAAGMSVISSNGSVSGQRPKAMLDLIPSRGGLPCRMAWRCHSAYSARSASVGLVLEAYLAGM